MTFKAISVKTTAFNNQKAGTSGLRQKTKVFMQKHYVENFIQSVVNFFATQKPKQELSVLLCSDGRYYKDVVIQHALNILVANSVKLIFVPKNGLMSTPAASHFLRLKQIDFALVLSASHNPAGENGDFGIKINTICGAPAKAEQMDAIYNISKSITSFSYLTPVKQFNIKEQANFNVMQTSIVVDDFSSVYIDYLATIFDFNAIAGYIKQANLNVAIDSLNAVTTIYTKELCKRLGISTNNIINGELKEDFGRYAADPNPKDAKHAYDMLVKDKKFDFACVFDGDGDRAMVLGKGIFISPADSVALLAYYSQQQSYYKNQVYGFARTFATTSALDKVAKKLNVPCYVVPTGWKYFTNLLDNKKITICGEESFGASSFHIREKDGIWVFLFWLDILRMSQQSVVEIANNYFKEFGRSYFLRYDYNNLTDTEADTLLQNLEQNSLKFVGKSLEGLELQKVYNACYFDEFDKTATKNQGLIIDFGNSTKIVARKSGTATGAVTLRVYIERYNNKDFNLDLKAFLSPFHSFFKEHSMLLNVLPSGYNSLDIIG